MLTILFDGVAYGMLLFVLAVGLAVTLGLMNFVNLAHGAFAMAGGYLTAVLSNRSACRSSPACRSRSSFAALVGAVLEPTLYRRLYRRPHLDQVLFSIGLVFMAVAAVDYVFGSQQQFVRLPRVPAGPLRVAGVGIGGYRAVHHRGLRRARARAAGRADAHALRQPPARGGRRPARGVGLGIRRQRGLRRRRSRSARGSRAWAARSAPRSSGSIRRFR